MRRRHVKVPVSCRFQTVVRRLERWRRQRKHRSPIPEALWAAAVQLAGEYGASQTARLLRLDYYTVKKRLAAEAVASRAGSPAQKVSSAFVELVGPVMSGSTRECTIELEHPCGASMRIELKGVGAPELSALTNSFWSAAR